MNTQVYKVIATLMLIFAVSCQKAKEQTSFQYSEREVWKQDEVPEIYENGEPVPTNHIFNCRRDISETSQRYFRLKINANRIEKLTSPQGAETTLYRFAQLKHSVKTFEGANGMVSYTDHVFADVDVTVEKFANKKVRMTMVLSAERPFNHNLYAPEDSDILQIQPGEEVARAFIDPTVKNQVAIKTKFQIMGGNAIADWLVCEFINL